MAQTKFSGPVVSENGFVGSFTGGTTNLSLSGTLAVTGTSTLTGNVAVGDNKFNVTAANGNTQIDGTLTVDGASTLTGNVAVGDNKFNVTAANGNTQIDGTLGVDGNATLTAAANVLVIPTSDPAVLNALWLDGSTIKVSAGA